jgi:hypothetical protein
MNDRTRRSFDMEFKRMVVELHKSGISSREIGREFGIRYDGRFLLFTKNRILANNINEARL